MNTVKQKEFTGTWLGRKATEYTFHFDKNRIGKRVCFHVWADTPNLMDVKVLKGSFWRGDGTERMFLETDNLLRSNSMQALAEKYADTFFKD